MKKNKIILTVGPPRSGKSTWSQQYIRENPNTVRVNADRLREMLFAYNPARIREYWNHKKLKENEQIIWYSVNKLVSLLNMRGIDVIVDNINLKKASLEEFETMASFYGDLFYIKEFNTPLNTCISRDQNSTRIVGKIYITQKYDQFLKLKETDYYKTLNKL